jgi:hypothetical protein
MSSDLSPELNRLIAQELAIGNYGSKEELLTEAVHLLTQRNALRQQIQAGASQLKNGEFTNYDAQSLRARFDDLKAGNKFNPRQRN